MLTALVNSRVFTGEKILENKAVILEDGLIKAITENENLPAGAQLTDCKGNMVAPGLIDLQIAGGGGFLFSESLTDHSLRQMTRSIVSSGTTGFLVAIPTNSDFVYHRAIEIIRNNPHPAVLGLHLEGPFISTARAGAHSRQHIRIPGEREVRDLLTEGQGVIKMITVAPEMCTPAIIALMTEYGVTVAAGHSNASYNEATKGFMSGIKTVTHLFNAMSPLHHRDPGLPGAAFMSETAYASIIADGIHVNYNMLKLSKSVMKERLFLVSDAVEECSHGPYLHVRQSDRFTLPDGTLSGSALTMLQAVKNCIVNAGITAEEALRMASTYPARVIGSFDRGIIREGCRADLVIFDHELRLTDVIVGGESMTQ